MSEKILPKEEKLKIIELSDNNKNITDEIINNKMANNQNHDQGKNILEKGQFHTRKPKCGKINNESEKYKVTLNLLNGLLKNMNKEEIDDITQFKNIKREDLLKESCNQILNEHIDNIIQQFGKSKIRYNMRNKRNCYVLSVIKYLVSFCGYDFVSNNISEYVIKNTMTYDYKSVVLYTIQ